MSITFLKKLSRNDAGETKSHQAGIAIPKSKSELLEFFPELNTSEFNPDTIITCVDPEGKQWAMRYVYYNGKLTGQSTRNEYRITRMTRFLKSWKGTSNDLIMFSSTTDPKRFTIAVVKQGAGEHTEFKPSLFKITGWSKAI